MGKITTQTILEIITTLYPNISLDEKKIITQTIEEKIYDIKTRRKKINPQKLSYSQKDLLLITYGETFSTNNNHSDNVKDIGSIFEKHLKKNFSGIHILPFYPSTSDD